MTFNATLNNISVISWRSILLVEESGENHRIAASHWQTLSQKVVSSTPRNEQYELFLVKDIYQTTRMYIEFAHHQLDNDEC